MNLTRLIYQTLFITHITQHYSNSTSHFNIQQSSEIIKSSPNNLY